MNEITRSVVSPIGLKYLPVIEFPQWSCHCYCLWATCLLWPESLVLADLIVSLAVSKEVKVRHLPVQWTPPARGVPPRTFVGGRITNIEGDK